MIIFILKKYEWKRGFVEVHFPLPLPHYAKMLSKLILKVEENKESQVREKKEREIVKKDMVSVY